MKKVTDLKENEGILCRTESEAKAIYQLLKDPTCFGGVYAPMVIYPYEMQHSGAEHATERGYKTHPASDFLTEKEIIGYKLKDEQYREAVRGLVSKRWFDENFYNNVDEFGANFKTSKEEGSTEYVLRNAGVLDLWFEPVFAEPEFKVGDICYWSGINPAIVKLTNKCPRWGNSFQIDNREETSCNAKYLRHATPEEIEAYNSPKLPKINGYEGKETANIIHYGCAELSKNWFGATENRHIKSMTLSSGVKITEEQMNSIRKYLAK